MISKQIQKLTRLLFSKFFAPFSSQIRAGIILNGSNYIMKGNLYTWGKNLESLGYKAKEKNALVPKKLDLFNENVVKVHMGPSHSAVITRYCFLIQNEYFPVEDGDLYTFGEGEYGKLGHFDKSQKHTEPKLVKFFKENNLKVIDAKCGENHTLALTGIKIVSDFSPNTYIDDGDVWAWGYGGRNLNFFLKLFINSISSIFLGRLILRSCRSIGHRRLISSLWPSPCRILEKRAPNYFNKCWKYVFYGHGWFFSELHNIKRKFSSSQSLLLGKRRLRSIWGRKNKSVHSTPKKRSFQKIS